MIKRVVLLLVLMIMLIPGKVGAATLDQLSESIEDAIYSGRPAIGERFNSWPASTITSIQFKLSKYRSPTGTLYVRVRAVSDNSILGTLGTLDVSTLTTTPTYKTFNASPVTVAAQDIRICAEFSGGSTTAFVYVRYYGANPYAGGYLNFYTTSWTEYTSKDCTWQALTWTTGLGLATIDQVAQASVSSLDSITYSTVKSIDGIQ